MAIMTVKKATMILERPLRFGNQQQIEAVKFLAEYEEAATKFKECQKKHPICDECLGHGTQECSECEGSGEVKCENCGGKKIECDCMEGFSEDILKAVR